MTTRAAVIRRAVAIVRVNGHSRGYATRDGVNALASTGGSTLTLIDTAGLPPVGAASTMAKGDWLYLPAMTAANQRRLVASYDASARTFTHGGPVYDGTTITALGVGTPYLVLKDDPDTWNAAVNEALRTILSQFNYDEVTPAVDRKVLYTMGAAPFTLVTPVRDSQIAEIEYRSSGDVAGEERWYPWANGSQTWKTYMDEDDVILDFGSPGTAPTTDIVLRVKWSSQFATVSAESTVIAADELFCALGTLVVMIDWNADPDNPSDDWNMLGRRIYPQYAARRRLILGEDAYTQVARTAQTAGFINVGGRAGRGMSSGRRRA